MKTLEKTMSVKTKHPYEYVDSVKRAIELGILEPDTRQRQAHSHTLDVKTLRGTSSIVDIIAKTLHWWSAELSAVECLEAGIHIPTIREEYLEAVKKFGLDKTIAINALEEKYPIFRTARHAHDDKKKSTAKGGTDMHGELEIYVKSCIENGGKPFLKEAREDSHRAVVIFSVWAVDNVDKFLWSEGHCYSRPLWVGGICDCGALMKNGNIAAFDFKSAKEAFFGHFVQVAGYAIQMEENGVLDKNGYELLKLPQPIAELYVVPFGAKDPTPRPNYDVEARKKNFVSALDLHESNEALTNQSK